MGRLEIGADDYGVFGTLACSRAGCSAHVALRPMAPTISAGDTYDLVCALFDMAVDDGWVLAGSAWCPQHRPRRARTAGVVGDAFDWLHVQRRDQRVKGPVQ